jgi:hypothetical protein
LNPLCDRDEPAVALDRPAFGFPGITFTCRPASDDFMHGVIARRGPHLAGLIAEARRQGQGWVVVVDQRTPTPQGAVPPEDIVGVFEVRDGKIVPDSYRASPKHLILLRNGFVQLGAELEPCMLEELIALTEPK